MSLRCLECGAKTLPLQPTCAFCGALVEQKDKDDANIGRILADKYELKELIGVGAMGRVYSAWHDPLKREVAVKVLHGHLTRDPQVAKRFEREAQAASRLNHPNSVAVLDFGKSIHNGEPTLYITMELLDGPDLLEVIEEESPLSPRQIVEFTKQILLVLAEAHHAGIIHRDLKPENVIVVDDREGNDVVKVCDFGIAKIIEGEEGTALTVSGFVCGTPEYIAPEQAKGETLDARADLYACGCVLYQMLTGSVPFKTDSALGTITRHLTTPPEPPRIRAPDLNIPESLEVICLKAMAKLPENRFQTADEMHAALDGALTEMGSFADERLGSTQADPSATHQLPDPSDDAVPAPEPREVSSATRWIVLLIAGLCFAAAAWWLGAPQKDAPIPEPQSSAPAIPSTTKMLPTLPVESKVPTTKVVEPVTPAVTQPTLTLPSKTESKDSKSKRTEKQPGAFQQSFAEGRKKFLSNDIPAAVTAFDKAAKLQPNNAKVYYELGRVHMRNRDRKKAVAAYQKYLQLAPNAKNKAIVEQIIEKNVP